MKQLRFFLLLTISLSFTGCVRMYGIKTLKSLPTNAIVKQANKYHIPASSSYVLDSNYRKLLASFDTALYAQQINNHAQPLQALYYNQEGQLVSFHINCYAGGFPNLNWNREENFQVFPPKQQAPVDSLVSLATLQQHLQALPGSNPITINPKQTNTYTLIVFWSRFMGRQSERFLQLIQENHQSFAPASTPILYVNTDNFFVP